MGNEASGEALSEVDVPALDPARFEQVLSAPALAEFERTIAYGRELLATRTFWNVNSTAQGGGVAELLRSLIGYARGAGLDVRWVVISGDPAFFLVTKRLHNRLHGHPGDGGPLGETEREIYERCCARNAQAMSAMLGPSDVVLLHDPQTAGLVAPLRAAGARVIWRAHVGVDVANDLAREAWEFLRSYVAEAESFVFSRRSYVWEGLESDKLSVIPPSIDAFSPKNHALSFTAISAILRAGGLAADGGRSPRATFERLDGGAGVVRSRARMAEEAPLSLDAPLLMQISRWDRLKDPMGVLRAFAENVPAGEEPHLLLAGPDVSAVTDDPEGAEVFEEVHEEWSQLRCSIRRRVHLALLPMDDGDENAVLVNALQRRADVVLQKSLAEGFGLTVAEAMWKGRPVVASAVGGIAEQIDDGLTGVLVDPRDLPGFGSAVGALLKDPRRAEGLGQAAALRVREHFLGPRQLGQYVRLLGDLLEEGPRSPPLR